MELQLFLGQNGSGNFPTADQWIGYLGVTDVVEL
jgi:hypothetical protein